MAEEKTVRYQAIERNEETGERAVELHDEETGAVICVRPDCGGTVARIAIPARTPEGIVRSGNAIDVLDPSPETPAHDQKSSDGFDPYFPGRILWPFSDRIPHGIYWFEGQDYRLPINLLESNDAIHGLIYDKPLGIEGLTADETGAELTLLSRIKPGDVDGYTFFVTLELRYRLDASGFTLSARGTNRGGRPAPVGLGWHPYFSLPDVDGIDELTLTSTANHYVPVDDRLLPTGEILSVEGKDLDLRPPAGRAIGREEFDIAMTGAAAIETVLSSPGYALTIAQSPSFAYQQLFTPPGRQTIAIEPITAATNAFNRPDLGLILLHHDETLEATCRITLTTR